jgi:hypothetical protein
MKYRPSANHPWKSSFKDRPPVEKEIKDKAFTGKKVKFFIQEISESWDGVEIITTAFGREGKFHLSELSESKQAAWLAGLLRKNYGSI